ncbi:amidase domain-containing protein [Sporolactobacillus sp. CPB3-1]|uniref:Amidase domain-containing protein n=1 Tax=Sporolactobacillus mangiferae TaxID=2940498 RepID=A0ABT0M7B4_9BACL|nr:amidase domain-containing protein [Sporolactobacillus mangiferae]
MDWKDIFQDHISKLGNYWVGAADLHRLACDADEERRMENKVKALRDQRAEIEQVIVHAEDVRTLDKREDLVIDYCLHTQWLIQRQQDFFLEERSEDRQAVIRNGRMVSDALIPLVSAQEAATHTSDMREPSMTRSRRYDRLQAVRYADLWWNQRNPRYPKVADDCTNYISQCLHAGGIEMWGDPIRNRGWWQKQTNWSFSWTVANSLRWYLSKQGNIIGTVEKSSARDLVPGDVICYDFEGDGHWNHNTMVTAIDGAGDPLVNAHTYDARHRPWAYTDSPAWTENIAYKFFHIKDQI